MGKKCEENGMGDEKEMGEWDAGRAGAPAPLEPNALGSGSLSSVPDPKLPGLIPEMLLPVSEAGKKARRAGTSLGSQGCPLSHREVPWITRVSLGSRGCPCGAGNVSRSWERLREQAGKGLGRTGPVPAVAAAR